MSLLSSSILASQWERGCWIASALGIALAVRIWRAGEPTTEDAPPVVPASIMWRPEIPDTQLVNAGRIVVEKDPFRLVRRPSPFPFGAEQGAPQQVQRASPLPALALAGIVGGPPWTAILEGLPGRDSPAVVQRGDTLSGFHIRQVTRHYVVVAGMDTVWKLALKQTWR